MNTVVDVRSVGYEWQGQNSIKLVQLISVAVQAPLTSLLHCCSSTVTALRYNKTWPRDSRDQYSSHLESYTKIWRATTQRCISSPLAELPTGNESSSGEEQVVFIIERDQNLLETATVQSVQQSVERNKWYS